MTDETAFFAGTLRRECALSDGACEREGALRAERPICGGQFRLEVSFSADAVFTRLIDVMTEEEYVLHRVDGAQGAFVDRVRREYRAALSEFRERRYDRSAFRSDDGNALLSYACGRYGGRPEHLWEREPSYAVLRRRDNGKWYAVFLTVAPEKLGLRGEGVLEIVDLRMRPQDLDVRADGVKYFRGWHMNKKHWVTVVLGGTLPYATLQALLDESYRLADKK